MSNYTVYKRGQGKPIKAWTSGVPVENEALNQLYNVADMPFIHRHVAVMPDVHFGIGATIGSVIPTKGAIIPAAVGVDIGCGMNAVKLDGAREEHLPVSLKEIRHSIERTIPVGKAGYKEGKYCKPPAFVADMIKWIKEKHPAISKRRRLSVDALTHSQFGTLGGGNHFIELCIDESGDLWVMLHSGSRGIGNSIGNYFIQLAKEDMRRHFINLPDNNLSYLSEGTDHFNDYVKAVSWAQDYAAASRNEMMRRILINLRHYLPPFKETSEVVSCHHNYVERENHFGANVFVTRKGAVRARAGDMGIIPGSMGTKSYIVRGLGNPESLNSCSHGAGRRMSRRKAKETFSLKDHDLATKDVECRKDTGVIDETPGAYKNIDDVMRAQENDLVEVVHTIRQVVCVKG